VLGVAAAFRLPEEWSLEACAARLKCVGTGLEMYRAQYGTFPSSLSDLAQKGFVTEDMLHSPLQAHLRDIRVGFAYVPGLRRSDPGNWPLAFDPSVTKHGERAVLFLSGEVRRLSTAEFEETLEGFREQYCAQNGRAPLIDLPSLP